MLLVTCYLLLISMPELPDLEVLKENIWHQFGGHAVSDVYARQEKDKLVSKLKNQKLIGITRRGKFLIFAFGRDEAAIKAELVLHLMLNGRLTVEAAGHSRPGLARQPSQARRPGTVLLAIEFDHAKELRLTDHTFWAKYWLGSDGHLDKLGVEPLSPDFTEAWFAGQVQKSRSRIKPLLMKQEFIAGLGNAYTDEALFAAKIDPAREAKKLGADEIATLFHAIKKVIPWGIEQIKKTVGSEVKEDEKRAFMKVYRKVGQECPRCGKMIQEAKLQGRDTFFCSNCQK